MRVIDWEFYGADGVTIKEIQRWITRQGTGMLTSREEALRAFTLQWRGLAAATFFWIQLLAMARVQELLTFFFQSLQLYGNTRLVPAQGAANLGRGLAAALF